MSEKVVVTGGAGFIGSHIVDELVARGYHVHVIDNLSAGLKENVNASATLHVADITEKDAIKPIFESATYVFHLAALPRVQYSIEEPGITNNINVGGMVNVLHASSQAGVKRFIYSASSAAYGDQDTMPLVETMEAEPKSPYGLQKFIGELYCKLWSDIYNLPTVSLRYANVYGPRQSSEGAYALVIAKFLDQKKSGKPMTITGDGEQTRDFVHVRDVVNANMLAIEEVKVGRGEVMNIGSGKNVSVNKIAELIGGPVEHIPPRLEPHDTLADITLALELLGWSPTISIEEGIKELLAGSF
jgi:UDP-glucose 4-epimerase